MRWPLPWPKSWREKAPSTEEPEDEDEEKPKSLKESVLLFVRDLIVAFVIVAIVMGVLFAYTRVWPPMVVVESDSMQHSDTQSSIGVIDTGDLVLVQAVGSSTDVVTYVEGRAAGYQTYSDFGDVIIFNRVGDPPGATPIIHRAMVYVYPSTPGRANVPSLSGLQYGTDWTSRPVGTTMNLYEFTLLNVGYRHLPVTYNMTTVAAAGFLTKGDHNAGPDGAVPVPVANILGKARGELPWFGLIKLTLSPSTSAGGCCPRGWGSTGPNGAPGNSWGALLISLIVIVAGPFAADFGWSYYQAWRKARRKAGKDAEADDPKEDEGPPPESPSESKAAPPAESEASPPTPGDGPTDAPRTESAEPEAGGPEGP